LEVEFSSVVQLTVAVVTAVLLAIDEITGGVTSGAAVVSRLFSLEVEILPDPSADTTTK
jgi:hypothetical protein